MLRSIGAPQAQDNSGMPSLTYVPGEPKTDPGLQGHSEVGGRGAFILGGKNR